MMKLLRVLCLTLLFSAPVMAQETAGKAPAAAPEATEEAQIDTPKYSPDYCQFTAQFPEKPYITHKCEGDTADTCFNLISYTKVFDLSTTITVEIICNPSTPAMYKEFTPETMESTVRAMTKDTVIEAYEIKSRQEEGYRQSGLLGRGRKGLEDTIYIAQLWIADHSIMSVEAQLIGEQSAQSDQAFAEILRNIGFTKDLEETGAIDSSAKPETTTESEETK
ncbi:MAG: hypothetical protein COB14_04560 [Alphaproteobacteria bacterium]|nr:MAG: hypothetical protein COB14_04560 [Alphaproteobacteria bacterium]